MFRPGSIRPVVLDEFTPSQGRVYNGANKDEVWELDAPTYRQPGKQFIWTYQPLSRLGVARYTSSTTNTASFTLEATPVVGISYAMTGTYSFVPVDSYELDVQATSNTVDPDTYITFDGWAWSGTSDAAELAEFFYQPDERPIIEITPT